MEFLADCGLQVAVIGSALAVGLACAGSGRGVGFVGEAAAGVLSEDPGRFAQCLILEIIPGTQGLYGLVIWFFALFQMGVIGGTAADMTIAQAWATALPACPWASAATYRRGPGPLRRGGHLAGGQAAGGAVQRHHHGHHGGVLRDPLPAGVVFDAGLSVSAPAREISNGKDGARAMNSIEKITQRIEEDARAEAGGILSDARRRAEALCASYEVRARREAREILDRGEKEAVAREARLAAAARAEAGKRMLGAKQELLNRLLRGRWPG